MATVTIYTQMACAFCVRAKNLLNAKGIGFEEINLHGKDDDLLTLRKKTGMRTLPQIFINDEFIGGFSELAALDSTGELDKKLKA